jgi:hypothetical protein|tara:strand:+ start:140 stop:517 length:378 start_codon:yes stop_codon:yes gene_type:complete
MSNEINTQSTANLDVEPKNLSQLIKAAIRKGIVVSPLKPLVDKDTQVATPKPGIMIYDASQMSVELVEQMKQAAQEFKENWDAIFTKGEGFNAKSGKKNTDRLYIGPANGTPSVDEKDVDKHLNF